MTPRARKLAVAAALAASIPAAALAHERECEHGDQDEDRPVVYAPPPEYAPPPAYPPQAGYAPPAEYPPAEYPPPAEYEYAPPAGWGPSQERPAPPPPRRWREGAWRERRVFELRAELRALDLRRAEAEARFGWSPYRRWRIERWYAARRAEIERRLWELQPVAWR